MIDIVLFVMRYPIKNLNYNFFLAAISCANFVSTCCTAKFPVVYFKNILSLDFDKKQIIRHNF